MVKIPRWFIISVISIYSILMLLSLNITLKSILANFVWSILIVSVTYLVALQYFPKRLEKFFDFILVEAKHPEVTYLENKDSLLNYLFNEPTKQHNALMLVKGGQVSGAVITTSGKQVSENWKCLEKGIVSRSSKERTKANVSGFQTVKSRFIENNGKKEFLYHRTHLIPFIMCLSEGNDLVNLLFTGTSYLNTGYSPVKLNPKHKDNLKLTSEEKQNTFDNVLDFSSSIRKRYSISGKIPRLDTQYSLKDLEIYIEKYMRQNPNERISYGVFCNYENNSDKIPESVDVYIVNESKNQLMIGVKLLNCLS